MAEVQATAGQIDRRALIKKVGAGAAVAWAAPTVLASTAGAQSTTSYFMKYEAGGCFSSIGGGDPCPQGQDDGKQNGCGAGHFSVSFGEEMIVISNVDANCTIDSLYFKAGNGCSADFGPTFPSGGTFGKSEYSPGGRDFSHVNISYTCTTSTGSI